MSDRKASKLDRQRSHTETPRPPYRAQSLLFGLVQRWMSPTHVEYMDVGPFLDA
jgi:hypothetical protein